MLSDSPVLIARRCPNMSPGRLAFALAQTFAQDSFRVLHCRSTIRPEVRNPSSLCRRVLAPGAVCMALVMHGLAVPGVSRGSLSMRMTRTTASLRRSPPTLCGRRRALCMSTTHTTFPAGMQLRPRGVVDTLPHTTARTKRQPEVDAAITRHRYLACICGNPPKQGQSIFHKRPESQIQPHETARLEGQISKTPTLTAWHFGCGSQ